MKSLLESLFDPDNDENLVLTDVDGREEEFEQIATIPLDGEVYALLHPVEEEEDIVVIFRLIDDGDNETLVFESDEEKQQRVYNAYNDLCDAEGV